VSDSSLDSCDEDDVDGRLHDDDALDATSPSSLPPEVESGNVEYKLKLVNPSDSRFEHLVTQMKWRLQEGGGEAIYEIGVKDCGDLEGLEDEELEESLNTLQRMATKLGASIHVLREHDTTMPLATGLRKSVTCDSYLASSSSSFAASGPLGVELGASPAPRGVAEASASASTRRRKRALEVLVRKVPDDRHFIDLRLAVLGHADAGKSTLLGVLTNGELDNGAGRARLNLFRHLHEIQTGRTSCISHEILGFDDAGRVLNYRQTTPPIHFASQKSRRPSSLSTSESFPPSFHHHQTPKTNEEICAQASKVIALMDLAGHPKYTKTTVFGLTGYAPHFAMLVVSANSGGLVGTTREHLGYALALEVPIFFVVSKLDLCEGSKGRETIESTIKQLESILTSPGVKKVPYRVTSEDSALTAASSLTSQTVSPIFEVSSVTGVGIDLLLKFLHALPPMGESVKEKERDMQEDCEFQVDEIFHIPSLGSIVGGRLVKGVIRVGDPLLLGPSDPTGRFVRVQVQSLHRNRAPCRTVQAGQAATLALGRSYPKSILRKGSVLLKAQPFEPSTTEAAASPSSLSSSAGAEKASYTSPTRFFAAAGSPLRNAQLGAMRRRSRRRSAAARASTSPRSSVGDDSFDAAVATSPSASLFPFEPPLEEVEALTSSSSSSASAPQPRACFSFEADIYVLFHPHGIGKNFQATVHIGNIRQTVVIEWIHASKVLKTGERAVVKFRFIKRPEYVTVGSRLIFRESNSKGMGNVTRVIHLGEEAEEDGGNGLKDDAHAR